MAVAPITTGTPKTDAQSSQAKLTGDLKSFLTLLTTQLKHQDPLDPVDSTEFTAQLAQFAAVEQGIQTNSNLEKLIGLSLANQSLAAVSYLGKYVEALGDGMALVNGSGKLAYNLPETAAGVAIQIQNEAGITVAVKSGPTAAGRHEFTWDGRDFQGLQLPDGKYSVTITAANADGNPIDAKTYTIGVVDGADSSGDEVMISINSVKVPLRDVTTVRAAPPSV